MFAPASLLSEHTVSPSQQLRQDTADWPRINFRCQHLQEILLTGPL